MQAIKHLVQNRIVCALVALIVPAVVLFIASSDIILSPAFRLALIIPGGLLGMAVSLVIYPFAMAFYDSGSMDGDEGPAFYIAISSLCGIAFWWFIGYVTLILLRKRIGGTWTKKA
ncbi:hypothetical protein NDN16_10535 [Aureimonas altamirensis]|uniref:hypothetical protein n=1 Tax=Aureimonas altamirensis TaxID=370622 RepID=UPI002037479B|nr:hypothetical protein [Aureimonas altamirensis]MCM2504108.1 hypothetical protein [Aureimonas altamirensis]